MAQETPNTVAMPRGAELGWKDHFMRVGDGKGGWEVKKSQFQFLHAATGKGIKPFGVAQMDNGEVMILASWDGDKGEVPVVAFSKDGGATWTDWTLIPGASGRPMMLANLGNGRLTFQSGLRYFSSDYGRTWPDTVPIQLPSNGRFWGPEGNPMVDFDAAGKPVRMAEIGYNYADGGWPSEPCDAFFRWSNDDGRTWVNESKPEAWRRVVKWNGKDYVRSICEGSLVRAKNGWLVALLRTDVHPRFIHLGNDNYCGTAVSISKDDGKSWSPMKVIWDAGRMHAHILRLKNGDLVMTYVMRQDMLPDSEHYASFHRGCGALVSKDSGITWDTSKEYKLDEFEFVNAQEGAGTLACGHLFSAVLDDGSILTAYSNYPAEAAALIRWRP